jgi:hypothetical protein
MDNESNELLLPVEGFGVSLEDSSKEEKKNRKGLLNWFKLRVCQLCKTLHLGLKMSASQYCIDSFFLAALLHICKWNTKEIRMLNPGVKLKK